MKVCTYINRNAHGLAQKRLGILVDETTIIDPNFCWAVDFEREGRRNIYQRADMKIPSSLSQLLKYHNDPFEILEESYGLYLFLKMVGDLETTDGTSLVYHLDEKEIKLASPLDKITSYRDFYAHEKHVKKGFEKRGEPIPPAWYEMPVYYKGSTEGFIGNHDEILWPSYTDILDYELELGMVVGKEGINIPEEEAVDHIFGLTILNDISARDIQRKEMAVRLGPAKGKDFCSVLGPVIVTMDEFDHQEPNLLMTAKINGEEWSRGHSADTHFNFAKMIAHVSQDEWVMPGDLFGSGTVGTGCGLELDKWIQPGDVIELEIEKIGKLTNKVGAKRTR